MDEESPPLRASDDVCEMVICHGPPKCDGNDGEPCPYCFRINTYADSDIDAIIGQMNVSH